MKTSNFLKRSLFIGICVFTYTSISASEIDLLRKDSQPPPPGPAPLSVILDIPVTATEDNSELAVYFEEAVGDATIMVYDASNQVVYQEVIDTDSQSAAFIDISAWTSGDYTLTISYGTTNLIGEFTIE